MIESLRSFELSALQWVLAVICGMFVGVAKTGIGGMGTLVVPILAGIFGGKPSAGLLLPMLSMGDVFGVSYYHRHADWRHICRLLPWAVAGIMIGLFVGHAVSDTQFKHIIGTIILLSIPLMVWEERRGENLRIPNTWWFSAITGLVGGFATMIGNAAGPIMALYLLSTRLPKNSFIGTGAWFFMIVNLIKIPLHVFVWGTITLRTFSFDVTMLPAIGFGAVLGVLVVRRIPERPYRVLVIIMTVIAAAKLFF